VAAEFWLHRRNRPLHRLAGIVRRNEAGVLVLESRADGVRSQTAVPRNVNVDGIPGR
jgi:hypothetical protein